jgi:hypothetical protein
VGNDGGWHPGSSLGGTCEPVQGLVIYTVGTKSPPSPNSIKQPTHPLTRHPQARGQLLRVPALRQIKDQRVKEPALRNTLARRVAHACNPSYSGGRDQEDCDLKPAQANSLRDPILKNPLHKRASGVAQGVDHEFKPQDRKKKKEHRTWSELSGWLVPFSPPAGRSRHGSGAVQWVLALCQAVTKHWLSLNSCL